MCFSTIADEYSGFHPARLERKIGKKDSPPANVWTIAASTVLGPDESGPQRVSVNNAHWSVLLIPHVTNHFPSSNGIDGQVLSCFNNSSGL
jgi:hypothetical protein